MSDVSPGYECNPVLERGLLITDLHELHKVCPQQAVDYTPEMEEISVIVGTVSRLAVDGQATNLRELKICMYHSRERSLAITYGFPSNAGRRYDLRATTSDLEAFARQRNAPQIAAHDSRLRVLLGRATFTQDAAERYMKNLLENPTMYQQLLSYCRTGIS